MINADNLPRVIYNLKKQNPDKFELLKDVYSQLFPDIEDVIVKQFKINGLTNNEELPKIFHLFFQIIIMYCLLKKKI